MKIKIRRKTYQKKRGADEATAHVKLALDEKIKIFISINN